MFNVEAESLVSKYLIVGVPFISLFLLVGTNTDPVNVPKLMALGGISLGVIAITLAKQVKFLWRKFRLEIIAVIFFNVAIMNATFQSDSPLIQNIYGVYGRNTGALTYILLSGLLISTLQMQQVKFVKNILFGLLVAGVVNILYCGWVLAFGDFLPWENPYGNILGLFGNPDFISAFLGMFIVCALAFCAGNEIRIQTKIALIVLSSVAFMEILKSHAIQGLVVTIGGAGIIFFFIIRSRFSFRKIEWIYAFVVVCIGICAIFGALQKGPFKFIYKNSVSLRGSYWHAGLGMGTNSPFAGVGMDAYGDWYRRTRPPVALVNMPGINTVSNASHNVLIDFFAFGGFPLLISYLLILFLGAISIVRVIRRGRSYNSTFVALAATWACYEVQSIVSINQIGLAIWGWVLTGLLISFDFSSRNKNATRDRGILIQKSGGSKNGNHFPISMIALLGAVCGIFIASPPFNADSKWFNALNSQNAQLVEHSLTPTWLNPPDSYKYALAVNLFNTSNLPDLAYKYVKESVKYNRDYFPAWKQLYFSVRATANDKELAIKNMKRLDPLNPDVTAP